MSYINRKNLIDSIEEVEKCIDQAKDANITQLTVVACQMGVFLNFHARMVKPIVEQILRNHGPKSKAYLESKEASDLYGARCDELKRTIAMRACMLETAYDAAVKTIVEAPIVSRETIPGGGA